MKLSKWAEEQGIQYGTALKWFHAGNLPVPAQQLPTGTILVDVSVNHKASTLTTVIYSRVSSATKRGDLNSQIELCESFCLAKGWEVTKVYKEVASGMNDNRRRLNALLDSEGLRVVVLHKDRLTRFGFRYLERLIKAKGGSIVVINEDKNDEEDLLKDMIAVITSFCCRLYGARRGQAKALKAKREVQP